MHAHPKHNRQACSLFVGITVHRRELEPMNADANILLTAFLWCKTLSSCGNVIPRNVLREELFADCHLLSPQCNPWPAAAAAVHQNSGTATSLHAPADTEV